MPTNFNEFSIEVNRFAERTVPEQLVALHKRLALEALVRVVQKTPVDTGRARSGWNTTVGTPDESIAQNPDPVSVGVIATSDLGPFQVVHISNNVIYIEFLEQGSSSQAPRGMVSVTVAELEALFT